MRASGTMGTCKGKRKEVRCWNTGRKDKNEEKAHAQRGWINLYERNNLPSGQDQSRGLRGNSECSQLQRKRVAENGIKITANNIGTYKRAWRYQAYARLQHPHRVTMDTLILRKQCDLHVFLGLMVLVQDLSKLGVGPPF